MILFARPQQLTISSLQRSSGFSPFFLMYGHEANAKHMILAWEVLKRFDSEVAVRVSGAAETVDYFG